MIDAQLQLTVEVPPTSGRESVLGLLSFGKPHIDRLLAAANRGELDLCGLYCARRGRRLVGAAWGQVTAGKSGFCWPAQIITGEPEGTAVLLQSSVDQYLDAAQVSLTQAVLEKHAVTAAARLERAGYQHLVNLDYLACEVDTFPASLPPSDVQFDTIPADDVHFWQSLVQRTYVGTLDCKRLADPRNLEEVVAGYRETGEHRSDWWLVIRHNDQDVGCALMADHPALQQCELMYLGIVPEQRGRGWGLQTLRRIQWTMRAAERQRIVLAVDEDNWPAQAMYFAAGFQVWDERSIYARIVA